MDDDIEDIYLDNDHHHRRPEHHKDLHDAVESREEYKKLARAILGLLLLSCILTTIRGWELRRFIADFMAIGFIGAAAFKFVNIEAFVVAYRRYDIIGSRVRPWAYIVPFVGAFLGFWYLLSSGPDRLNIVAIIVTALSGFGALRTLRQGSKGHPSLGGIFHVPLLKISVFENVVLFVLAAVMIII